MNKATVTRVEAEFPAFIKHHQVTTVAAGDVVEFGDALGSGAFGSVHPAPSVAGIKPPVALVIKVFDPAELQLGGGAGPVLDAISGLHDSLPHAAGAAWANAFKALPYQLFTLRTKDGDRLAALMLDLSAAGYRGAPFADEHELQAYRKLTVDARTALAVNVTSRFAMLERVGFVHGDLNAENLMWHPQTSDVQLIDFDSGTLVRSPADRPRAAGKGDGFMPPEVQDPQAPSGVNAAQFKPESERWSFAIVIGHFLFSVHPACFLNEISPTSISGYASATERWPDVDQHGPLFTQDPANQRVYPQVLKVFATVPSEVTDLFAALFDAGLNAAARPTANDWLAGLSGLSDPPTVEVVLLTDDIVLEGDDVVVAWRAENATHVELVPGGRQPASGSMRYIAKDHFRVTVTAHNAFGSDVAEAPVVRVIPLPRLERVVIPDFPGLQLSPLSVAAPAPDGCGRGSHAAPPPSLARGLLGRAPSHAHVRAEVPPPPMLQRFPGLLGRPTRARDGWRSR